MKRLTKDQREAVRKYEIRLSEEDRYFGSVFVNSVNTAWHEAKTAEAYENAKRLGVSHLC